VLFVIFGFPLITMGSELNFTAIGHFTSIFIGLCFYPMTRTRSKRSGPLSPARLRAMARRNVPPATSA
jgi:hypothetical protein